MTVLENILGSQKGRKLLNKTPWEAFFKWLIFQVFWSCVLFLHHLQLVWLLGAGPELTQDVACGPAALADQPLQEPDDDYPHVAGHEDQKESTHNIGNNCC